MIVGGRDFSDIYDLVGIRILVDEDRDCYSALGVIHSRWNPVLGRFKDYVAMPKFNMYQSLHTTVIGPAGKPVEVQIRTFSQHRRAEYGVAAHWKYKENSKAGVDTDRLGDKDDLTWLRQLLDWQSEVEDPGEFLESLRFEMNQAQVYVFTPRGDVIPLPVGATPVDFAYAVHTEVGHHTIGSRVNGRLVPLESTLDNGDVVEVFTSKSPTSGPSRDWLNFVQSPRARSKIRQWFTKERREEAIEHGKDQIAKLMRKEGLPLTRLMTHDVLALVAEHFHHADVSALYAAVGEGNLSAQAVVRRVIDLHGGDDGAQEDMSEGVTITGRSRAKRGPTDSGVIVPGVDDLWVKLAKCCTPVPPDPILGFVTKGGGVSVHRTRLHQRLQPARPARAGARGRVGADLAVDLPGQHPGRGARPRPPALRHHHGALRRPREHPQRDALHDPRPGGQEPVLLRDGRRRPPRRRAPRRPRRARRLRRLPRHRLSRREVVPVELEKSAAAFACAMSRNACLLASSDSRSLAALGVAGGRGLVELGLRLGDAGLELADHVVGAGRLLRVAAAPLLVLDRADGLLDLADAGLEVLHPVARHLAGGVPPVGEVAEGLLGRVEVGRPGRSFSASTRICSLTSALAANSSSSAALAASRAPKNVSCAPRKRCQSWSSTSRGAGPAAFHSRIRSRYCRRSDPTRSTSTAPRPPWPAAP